MYEKLSQNLWLILNSNESVNKEIDAKSLNYGFCTDFLYAFGFEFSISDSAAVFLSAIAAVNSISYHKRILIYTVI